MTAVDTTIHYLTPAAERSSFGYPNTVIIRNPDTSDDCLFILLTVFFLRNGFFYSIFFSASHAHAHGYGFFPCASPSNGCSGGWEGQTKQKRLSTKARPGFFAANAFSAFFWNQWEERMASVASLGFFLFCSQYSTWEALSGR